MSATTKTIERIEPCQICGRWLVTVYSDATFDIAGKARVELRIRVDELVRNGRALPETIPGSSTCFLWWCRIRKFWRSRR